MVLFRTLAMLVALVACGSAYAETECADPIGEWKPRELLRQAIETHGWTVQRIKIDDGCYEVRGIDRLGNKIKAKYAPASLRIRRLEVDFGAAGDASDYLPAVQPKAKADIRTDPTNKGK